MLRISRLSVLYFGCNAIDIRTSRLGVLYFGYQNTTYITLRCVVFRLKCYRYMYITFGVLYSGLHDTDICTSRLAVLYFSKNATYFSWRYVGIVLKFMRKRLHEIGITVSVLLVLSLNGYFRFLKMCLSNTRSWNEQNDVQDISKNCGIGAD